MPAQRGGIYLGALSEEKIGSLVLAFLCTGQQGTHSKVNGGAEETSWFCTKAAYSRVSIPALMYTSFLRSAADSSLFRSDMLSISSPLVSTRAVNRTIQLYASRDARQAPVTGL